MIQKFQYHVSRLSEYHFEVFSRVLAEGYIVPSICRKFLLLITELLHVKQSSKPFKIYSTGGILVDRFNEIDFTVSKPDLLSMLGNMLTVSKLK